MTLRPLLPQQLYRVCDCHQFDFETTDDLDPLEELPGQERALEALRFGAAMPHPDYHIYLLGGHGTGRHRSALATFEATAKDRPTPDDWVYVHNFNTPHQPRALALPPGRGPAFADEMRDFIEDLTQSIPAAFERDENRGRIQAIDDRFRKQQEGVFAKLDAEAKERGFALTRTQQGVAFVPYVKGEVNPKGYEGLSEAEAKPLHEALSDLQSRLKEILQDFPRQERARRQEQMDLHREIIADAVREPLETVRAMVSDVPAALRHLDKVRKDIKANFHLLLSQGQGQEGAPDGPPRAEPLGTVSGLRRYEVNLLVQHNPESGAPVVQEDNPNLANLLGRVEQVAQMGTLVTDFSLIKPGALHKSNGGFLVLDAAKLFSQPYAWEALKRNLKAEHVVIENPAQSAGLVSTVSLTPDPIPLQCRVALVGSPRLFHLAQQADADFAALFKVAADFSDTMTRSEESDRLFARLIASMVREAKLLPFDIDGVARLIEAASRRAADSQKLALDLQHLYDLVREADFFAREAGAKIATRGHVQAALSARIRRADRIREASHEQITRDIMLIDSDGGAVGQVNGLSVLQLGRFSFGKPTRITCNVRPGSGRIVDIEREVKLGGPLHSKGVLILQGFLAGTFVPDGRLSLSASLVFEQSYGGVDGDSASSTELYALLSALSGLPLRQDLAITGSVNQKGEVQAIGGVNEKVEGFFDICQARELTGQQGVMIPKANVVHLMLRDDVVSAAANARFHIYPVETIAEGIELLTGVPAGTRDEAGAFPADSVFGKVEARLRTFAKAGKKDKEDEEESENGKGEAGREADES
ncbi:MAG: ATP-binding protein [Rhodospirillales bacterium]